MFDTVLVADRGETAVRVIRTCQRLGVRTAVAHRDGEEHARHVLDADESLPLGPAELVEPRQVVEAAQQSGAQAVHPGAGPLAADAEIARAVEAAGLVWVGAPADVLERLRDPQAVRELAAASGLPLARPEGDRPLVDLQLLGLADGRVVALGSRQRSVRWRGRTLVAEVPAPGLADAAELRSGAVRVGEVVGLRGAGSVQLQPGPGGSGFLAVVPHLQAEHPATELAVGVDLVEQQLRVAAGLDPSYDVDDEPVGCALELSVLTGGPVSQAQVSRWLQPSGEGIRVDAALAEGDEVPAAAEPLLLAVVTVTAPDRAAAVERARQAMATFAVEGVPTNLGLLTRLLDDPGFVRGDHEGLAERLTLRT